MGNKRDRESSGMEQVQGDMAIVKAQITGLLRPRAASQCTARAACHSRRSLSLSLQMQINSESVWKGDFPLSSKCSEP